MESFLAGISTHKMKALGVHFRDKIPIETLLTSLTCTQRKPEAQSSASVWLKT